MASTPKIAPDSSYIEWSAVIAGTVLACAVSLVLLQFGNALGFSITTHYDASYTPGKVLVIGLWLLWVQLMASMSGGYLAGRMRSGWMDNSHEGEIRDGAHGLLVWASSSLVAAAAAAIGGVLATIAAHHGVDVNVENEARVSADLARRYTVIFGFGMVASYIVSAVAGYWLATIGGDHRDKASGGNLRIYFRRK